MTEPDRPARPGIWKEVGALLTTSWTLMRAGGARLAALIAVSQLVILGIAFPLVGWLFREALRASGLTGLDMGQLQVGSGFPITLALIIAIVVLAFWVLSLQFTALVVLLRWPQVTGRVFLGELARVGRKLLRPGALSMVFYLFLLVPFTGFGFVSALTRGISIPLFVSGELAKSVPTQIGYTVFLIILALLNIRFALTVPAFVLTDRGRAARMSWRLTRGLRHSVPLVLSIIAVLLAASIAGGALLFLSIAPTALADAVAPGAAHIVAAYSLGIAQVAGFFLTGAATALLAGVLITAVRRGAERLPEGVTLVDARHDGPQHHHRSTARLVAAGAVIAALLLGTFGINTMQRLSDTPQSLVLAHRGFSDGGVENTISGLDAAHAAGADLVEMDVMQTADGEFVAMHDITLSRLAGEDLAVKDLALDELTSMTVHNLQGHEDLIPSFADYVTRAQELGMPLLIEIKLSGAETDDHVDRLIAELEELGALEQNIYHSLDAPSVERLKLLRPDLAVGYTMAFAAVDVPETNADFVVVEEWSASQRMQDAATAAGLGFMAWTVNDEEGIREHLRRGTNGIVSDHPDVVLELRDEMQEETGLAGVLFDALTRFVTVV